MIIRTRRAVVGAALTLAVATGLAVTPAHATASPDRLRTELTAIVDDGATSALAVVKANGRTTVASAGPRRIDRPGPVDPDGRFRAGSVTKTFLATVVLQLVDAGRVGLDDPISRYVRGIPRGGRITVRMLLGHTSGLYNLTQTLPLNPPSGFLTIRNRHWTPRELLARATAHAPAFDPPGSAYAYSDTDYLVLGLLVRRVTGHEPATEIARRITRPLHLHETDVPGTSGIAGPHAHAYLPRDDGTLADITRFDPSVLAYAGDVVSSGRDLNRFVTALDDGRLLRPATTRLMRTVEPPATDHALGVVLLPLTCGPTAVGHDGDVPGSSTWSYAVPHGGRAVTVSMSWGMSRPKTEALTLVDDALCGRLT